MKRYVVIEETLHVSPRAKTKGEMLDSASDQGELNGKFNILGETDTREEAFALCRENGWYSSYDKRTTRGFATGEWRDAYFVKIYHLNEADPDYDETVLDLIDDMEGYDVMPFLSEDGSETESITEYGDAED